MCKPIKDSAHEGPRSTRHVRLTPRPRRSPYLIKRSTLCHGGGNRNEKLAKSRRNFCECLCVGVKARLVEESSPLSVLLLVIVELRCQRQRSIWRNRCATRFQKSS